LNQLEIQGQSTQMRFLKFEPTEIIGRFTIFVGLEELKKYLGQPLGGLLPSAH
jgi:hypothetical protein